MKTSGFVLLAGLILWGGSCVLFAGTPSTMLTSPDHPRTWWTNGDEKLGQYLTWDDVKGVLVAHVTYGLDSNQDSLWRPTRTDTFLARFPAVRLNGPEQQLYYADAHKHLVPVGRVESGVFGKRVELERNLELKAYRQDGVLHAAISAEK